jgi:hypothetical protein
MYILYTHTHTHTHTHIAVSQSPAAGERVEARGGGGDVEERRSGVEEREGKENESSFVTCVTGHAILSKPLEHPTQSSILLTETSN